MSEVLSGANAMNVFSIKEDIKEGKLSTKKRSKGNDTEEVCIGGHGKSSNTCEFVRRSERNPVSSVLDNSDVTRLLSKVRENHPDTVVLKVKDHVSADMHPAVFEKLLEALNENRVCQALYVQNLGGAITDDMLLKLTDLLKRKSRIWALNAGESYNVSTRGWVQFCNDLPDTCVTHLYISEHTIDGDLKNKMREYIRINREKHRLHNSLSNMKVIERVTHMWWNPINYFKHQETNAQKEEERKKRELEEARLAKLKQKQKEQERLKKEKEKAQRQKEKEMSKKKTLPLVQAIPVHLNPKSTVYWTEGYGAGGNKPWKFKCCCGEICSSYENYRYHPVGRQFECGVCSVWSHVLCELGDVTDDDIEEMGKQVMCKVCSAKARRDRAKELRDQGITLVEDKKTGGITVIYHDNYNDVPDVGSDGLALNSGEVGMTIGYNDSSNSDDISNNSNNSDNSDNNRNNSVNSNSNNNNNDSSSSNNNSDNDNYINYNSNNSGNSDSNSSITSSGKRPYDSIIE